MHGLLAQNTFTAKWTRISIAAQAQSKLILAPYSSALVTASDHTPIET
jgi:hypothetical protein